MPWFTLAALTLIGGVSIAQLTFAPTLLARLERSPATTTEPWRLLTATLVQDGGLEGTVYNLLALLVVGAFAEQWWPRSIWLALALTGSLAGNLAGVWLQPVGAGNSALVFALSASLAVLRAPLALAAAVALLACRDLHGVAALAGALLAWHHRARVLP